MDCEDRRIGPHEVSDDILADTAVDVHQLQASTATDEMGDIWMAMRDRLRAISCPSEMIDQIGGWSSGKVGEGYGEGFEVSLVNRFIMQT